MTQPDFSPVVTDALNSVGVECVSHGEVRAVIPRDELWLQRLQVDDDGMWHRWDNGQWTKDQRPTWVGATTSWNLVEASLIWRYHAQLRAIAQPQGAPLVPSFVMSDQIVDPVTHGFPPVPAGFTPVPIERGPELVDGAQRDGVLVAMGGFASIASLHTWDATPQQLLADIASPHGGKHLLVASHAA